MTGHRS